jgi:hypothetical protein
MVTDHQVKRLFKLMNTEKTFRQAALKAGMDEKTARKYRDRGTLPSELTKPRRHRTRKDPFKEVWPEVKALLEVNPGLYATTLLTELQRRYPGRFQDGQLRTLQRKIKKWRALEGPPKEIFFPQVHTPGRLCQSDFTDMRGLGVRVAGERFDHLIYHFVLTYSNWETGRICFSESFEALSAGLQEALFELGGVPKAHQTDRLTAAVNADLDKDTFQVRYAGLLRHYGLEGKAIQAGSPEQNGDIEKRHDLFKKALDQQLMLRGSREFENRTAYETFLGQLFQQLNSGRTERLDEEIPTLRALPAGRIDPVQKKRAKVRRSATIRVANNTYSVPSRLIGEKVQVHLRAETVEIWYAQRLIEEMPRLRGSGNAHIEYRHVIDGLVRKPGAFENYVHRAALFPTSRFREAYDAIKARWPSSASKRYLKILQMAAKKSESGVEKALKRLLGEKEAPTVEAVGELVAAGDGAAGDGLPSWRVEIEDVALSDYDALLEGAEGSRDE